MSHDINKMHLAESAPVKNPVLEDFELKATVYSPINILAVVNMQMGARLMCGSHSYMVHSAWYG